MITPTVARSISRQVKTWLDQGQSVTRMSSVFKSACNLVTDGNEAIALVMPRAGDGPFNVVLDSTIDFYATIGSSANVTSTPDRLTIGRLEIDLGKAVVWDPRPDWQALRARCITRSPFLSHSAACGIQRLYALGTRHARHSTFVQLLDGCFGEHITAAVGARSHRHGSAGMSANPKMPRHTLEQVMFDRAQQALGDLRAGWDGDQQRLYKGAAALAGLGGGLTPAGDDFLAGAMLWAWLAHPTPGAFCVALVETAAPLTNSLSAAFLRAAARGQCSAAWHAMLSALAGSHCERDRHSKQVVSRCKSDLQYCKRDCTRDLQYGQAAQSGQATLDEAVHRILNHGATSGADALLGFLCFAGHCTRRDT